MNDVQKNRAVNVGEWIPTAMPQDPEHRSFHLSSIYSPWTKLGELASRFVAVKDAPGELQDFINSELGEPFERISARMKDGVISEREGQYDRGTLFHIADLYKANYDPDEAAVMLGVDVQKNYLVACARAFTKNGDSGQVDRRHIGSFQELNNYANELNVHSVMMDSGYRTQEVYEASLAYKFVPTKGSSFRVPGVWEQTQRDIYDGTRKQNTGHSVAVILFDPNQMKDQLLDRINGDAPFAWLVPRDTAKDEDYCKQMQAEVRDDAGKWKQVRTHAPNHWLDAEVLCLLAATVYGYNTHIMEEVEDGQ